ncbi:UDP-glucose 4-epimerase GalE [Nocardioides montaniterrae]
MKILVTGGAGYLGSVTCTSLEAAGHTPIVLDSLVTGPRAFVGDRIFYEGDVADRALVRRIVADHPDLDATIHMAALVVVPQSVAHPVDYYRANVVSSLELFDELATLGRPGVVFSSSASVYGPSAEPVVTESSPLAPASPYARTKTMVEAVLRDLAAAGRIRAVNLRYFNPIGSDPDVRSGIHARELSHVIGQLARAALGQQAAFTITGTDWDTRDGTGVRDYIHAWDLARAHVRAVERLTALTDHPTGEVTINLGTGSGVTVRELIATFEEVFGRPVPVVEGPARPGDIAGSYAGVDRARDLLDWRAELGLADGIASTLAWSARRQEVLGYA